MTLSACGGKSLSAQSTPFIKRSSRPNDLFQNFVVDPQAPGSPSTFTPNYIPFPFGADLTALAVPGAGLDPTTFGSPLNNRHGDPVGPIAP